MLSIVIPTLNAEASLAATLPALVREAGRAELVVSDGGSSDRTAAIARDAGALVVAGPAGRGAQLAAGAKASSGDWLLPSPLSGPPRWLCESMTIFPSGINSGLCARCFKVYRFSIKPP